MRTCLNVIEADFLIPAICIQLRSANGLHPSLASHTQQPQIFVNKLAVAIWKNDFVRAGVRLELLLHPFTQPCTIIETENNNSNK